MLIECFLDLLDHATQNTFAQFRTRRRAVELAFGAICALGRQHQDWSADYKLFSRSPWDPNRLFHPVLETCVDRYPDRPLVVGHILSQVNQRVAWDPWRLPGQPPQYASDTPLPFAV